MSLSQFPTIMPAAVASVIRAATALRYIKNTTGDLPYSALDEVQGALRESKSTTFAALAEGLKAPTAAESFMASLGGPETLTDYQYSAFEIENKASAWNDLLETVLNSLPVDAVQGMVTISYDGIVTRHREYKSFIPATYAVTIRESQELVDLIAAFETVGA